ncbi:carbohydrate ABC transporter permease [Williamsia sp. CHRR-6]|uniref:carbohydrate ABC transporter permease n=1 Tax=Williamsia sp. CHRR-6 TaxID=2835871 RepID=UPI001BD93FDA|nr:carbohydrate ABC transporter permease [Williamsia sp. CHRR-6]MBT0566626.1 carbohydrate ABC transporter permease [Williamsia sp. CHRR-6]
MSIGLWIALAVSAAVWAAPFVFVVLTSFKGPGEVNTSHAWELPKNWVWSNYSTATEVGDLWTAAGNSMLIAVIKVPLGLLLSAAAAFAIARIRFRLNMIVLIAFTVGALVPVQVTLGPLFITMLDLDLLDSRWGIILPYLAFGVPFQIFMLYGFFRAVPDELEEAARVDGASLWRQFWSIFLPLARPALAALFILDFVASWNEYAMATTLLQSQRNATVPLAVRSFSTQFGTDYGALNAFLVLSVIPVLLVFLIFQRYFVRGGFSGAIKS